MSQAVTVWEDFQTELASREQEIASMLPRHVSKERFMASAVAAVKQTPGLLKATPRSLFGAVTKSAQDGLLPDGREGVITVYGVRQKDGSFLQEAQWNPMTHGLRKRARELDELLVDAQVVYKNDHFIWHQGDDPKIEHEPSPLGTERGPMIGAYAIFRNQSGILHREVMEAGHIETVRQQSKQPDGLLWGKFTPEAWRKTVVRRGFKTVPCSEKLQTIVERDDSGYDFDDAPAVDAPPRPQRVAYQPEPPAQGEDFDERARIHTRDHASDETGSAGVETNGAQDGPGEEAAAELQFVDGEHVILRDGDGEEVGRYKVAGHYFNAVKAQISKVDDPRGFLEINQPGAQHFVNQDESRQDTWTELWAAANEAQVAQGSVA